MNLTDFSDYSLRVLIYLNQTKEQATLSELAETLELPRNHLIKISNRLAKLGFIEATRGRAGGIRIREGAGATPLGTIIQGTEERIYLAECSSKGKIHCTLLRGCILKEHLQDALRAFIASLNQHTLDDITPARRSLSLATRKL